jgi:hypothetical protein
MSRRFVILAAVAISIATAAPKRALPERTAPPTPSKASAIWPEKLGDLTRDSVQPAPEPDNPALWEEYGFDTAERATYSGAGRKLTATAYRMKDPTGAVSVYELVRPASAKPAKLADYSVSTDDGAIVLYGNYVLEFDHGKPSMLQLKQLATSLPKLDQSSLPALIAYLPDAGLVRNSERYILGPESLKRVEPRIPPSTAAFHLGAEAQAGRFHTPKGDMSLLVFSYPTPSLARERESEFRKLPGAVVKRAGPLVAVSVAPPNADDAERTLAAVKYQPAVTWNEHVPQSKTEIAHGVANLVLGNAILALVLIASSVLLGLFFGGFRMMLARFGIRSADPGLTTLDLGNK